MKFFNYLNEFVRRFLDLDENVVGDIFFFICESFSREFSYVVFRFLIYVNCELRNLGFFIRCLYILIKYREIKRKKF